MRTSRREFLKRSAAASAVVSLPFVSSRSQVRAQDVNSQLTVAAIGVGGSRGAYSQGGAIAQAGGRSTRA